MNGNGALGTTRGPWRRSRIGTLMAVSLLVVLAGSPALAAEALPPLWTAGGASAGTDGGGQAARITSDTAGNVAVVSGPAGRDLLVRSYTPAGSLRWQRGVSPSAGTFTGDWIAAAPDGDLVAVGHNVNSSGQPIAITMVRYGSDGTLRWRRDLARMLPWVGRLVVDGGGNAYLAINSVGDGQDIELLKYDPSGALRWARAISTGPMANDIATSLALSPDETQVVVTGDILGGATWITASYDAASGTRNWLVTAAEGIAARDVVVDASRVYVTGQGNAGTSGFLTVIAYDRTSGARLWRTDRKPADAAGAAGLRIARTADGQLVVTGQASRGFLDWFTVGLRTDGSVRWEAVRDGGLNTDEVPRAVLALANGTTVVTGPGGPNLPGGYIQGVTAGYGPGGSLLWEAFSAQATVWATELPNGDVCATGGYDALITCWRIPDPGPGGGALLATVGVNPSTVTGGSPSTGTVTLDAAAPAGGATVALSSSDPSVAGVPASVTVPEGSTSGSFTVTTTPVGASTSVGISATFGGVTRSAALTVAPAAVSDTVAISSAQYRAARRQLTIQATSTSPTATLTAFVSATNEVIGILRNDGRGKYSGVFAWPTNPQQVTVRSSLGGVATRTVTLK